MTEQASADCVHQKKILRGVIVVKDIMIVNVMCTLAVCIDLICKTGAG